MECNKFLTFANSRPWSSSDEGKERRDHEGDERSPHPVAEPEQGVQETPGNLISFSLSLLSVPLSLFQLPSSDVCIYLFLPHSFLYCFSLSLISFISFLLFSSPFPRQLLLPNHHFPSNFSFYSSFSSFLYLIPFPHIHLISSFRVFLISFFHPFYRSFF